MKYLYILLLVAYSSTAMSAVGKVSLVSELGRTPQNFRIITADIRFADESLSEAVDSAEIFLKTRMTQYCRAYSQDFKTSKRSVALDADSTMDDYSGLLTIIGECKRKY